MRGGQQSPATPVERRKIVKTVRLNHLRAALLAVAAAGLLAAVGLMVLYAQPAEANYPGKPGKIAYAGEGETGAEIYAIKPDGGGKRQLTFNTTVIDQPAYSPNGKRVAYSGYDGNDFEIYTIKAGGGNKRQLTDNSANERYPYYSPSGKRIAYSGTYPGPGNDPEIYT